MDAALRAAGPSARPVDVVVELGAGEGARTGVRTEAECAKVADAVAVSARWSEYAKRAQVEAYIGEVARVFGAADRAYW